MEIFFLSNTLETARATSLRLSCQALAMIISLDSQKFGYGVDKGEMIVKDNSVLSLFINDD